MPTRYRSRHRYRVRPRRLARHRKFTKVHKPIGSGSEGKRFFKLREYTDLATTAQGTLTLTISDSPEANTDWASITNLFDRYRVCAMKFKFIPRSTTVAPVLNNASPQTWSLLDFFPMFVLHDVNSATLTGTQTAQTCLQYESCQVKNAQRPWKYYRKMVRNVFLSATATDKIIDNRGYQPTGTPSATQCFYLALFGTSAMGVMNIGSLVVTRYVVAKSRK